MPSRPPFVNPATGELDTSEILSEAIPLGKLIGVFAAISLIPFGLVFLTGGRSGTGAIFLVVAQLVLAIGGGIVLMYVIARGKQLADA